MVILTHVVAYGRGSSDRRHSSCHNAGSKHTVIQTITQVSVQKKSTIFRFSFLWKYVTVILHVFNAPWGNKSFEDISN
jgi:hypothetical protein